MENPSILGFETDLEGNVYEKLWVFATKSSADSTSTNLMTKNAANNHSKNGKWFY